jgi:hypothetical protein
MVIDEDILGYRVLAKVSFFLDSFGVRGSEFIDADVNFISVEPIDLHQTSSACRETLAYIKQEIIDRYAEEYRYTLSPA